MLPTTTPESVGPGTEGLERIRPWMQGRGRRQAYRRRHPRSALRALVCQALID